MDGDESFNGLHQLHSFQHFRSLLGFYLVLISLGSLGDYVMESLIYVFLLVCTLGLLFFAIAFREPPRITRDKD
ncbi:MAG: hypothetical protein Fur0046_18860 [Cyanobacteria bacterium J069]